MDMNEYEIRDLNEWEDEKKVTGQVGSCTELWWLKDDKGGWTGPLKNWREDSEHFLSQVKAFDTVVQAGGCCGMYPRFYSDHFKNVYTFEPNELNMNALKLNCVGPQFHIYDGGLGDDTTKKLSVTGINRRNVGTSKISEQEGDIQMYRIDDLNLSSCDLIHLDIEGYEKNALMGALETIKKFKPVIILERANGFNVIQELGYVAYKKLAMDTVYICKN